MKPPIQEPACPIDRKLSRTTAEPCGFVRYALLVFGCINVITGLIGVVVPGLPTTVFLIIATWAFSKSSVRFHQWLWSHPKFGPPIRAWHEHRVIPYRAKVAAISMMAASFLFVVLMVAKSWVLPLVMIAVLVPSAAYIASRASTPEEFQQSGSV